MNNIKIKRVYEEYAETDGYRILVDRLWPRGMTKEKAHIDYWAKIISPSTELRKTFSHDVETWEEFRMRYIIELDNNEHADEFISLLKEKLQQSDVTLLYAAKNKDINHVIVLKEWINDIK